MFLDSPAARAYAENPADRSRQQAARPALEAYRAELAYSYPDRAERLFEAQLGTVGTLLPYAYPHFRLAVEASRVTPVHSEFMAAAVRAEVPDAGVVRVAMPVTAPAVGAEEAAALRARLGFTPDDFVVGSFGLLTPEKQIETVARAVARAAVHVPRIRLLLVGPVPDPAPPRSRRPPRGSSAPRGAWPRVRTRLARAGAMPGRLRHGYRAGRRPARSASPALAFALGRAPRLNRPFPREPPAAPRCRIHQGRSDMHRLFSDLVVSRDGATARRAGLAFPASLVLHAAALTLLVLVSIITRDALPPVEAPSGPMPPFVRLPPEGGSGPPTPPARAPRPPRPAPPSAMAFVTDTPRAPTRHDVLDALEGPPDSVVPLPCSRDCVPGDGPGGVPGGDTSALDVGAGPPPAPVGPIRTGGD